MTDAQPKADELTRLTRLARRKAATRAALIDAAQRLMAEGRTNVPVQEITEAADLGTGSFYNHFQSKAELFATATNVALERQADILDSLAEGVDDPAVVFAQNFRLTGRMHRIEPQLSKVIINNGLSVVNTDTSMAQRARRDIQAAADAGRYRVDDIDAAMLIVLGSALALGQLVHDRPDLDDSQLTDRVTRDLLLVLGLTRKEAAKICSLPLPDLGPM